MVMEGHIKRIVAVFDIAKIKKSHRVSHALNTMSDFYSQNLIQRSGKIQK